MKLLSILMPTVNPHEWLIKALDSIRDTASDFTQIEILLRIDDTDNDRIHLLNSLDGYNIKSHIGPKYGYLAMSQYVNELLAIATGRWVWLFDDDAWIEGGTWQEQLAALGCDRESGPAVQPDHYRLGPSDYPKGCGAVSLIVPIDFARDSTRSSPVDQCWHDELSKRRWKIEYLADTTYSHDGRPR